MGSESEIKIDKQAFIDTYKILKEVYKCYQDQREKYIEERQKILNEWKGEARSPAEEEFNLMRDQLIISVNNMEGLANLLKDAGNAFEKADNDISDTISGK